MKNILYVVVLLFYSTHVFSQKKALSLYKDSKLPIEKRVEDLLGRMTIEEKFWQLYMMPGDLSIGKDKFKNGLFGFQVYTYNNNDSQIQQILKYGPGLAAKATAEHINQIQKFFIEQTRLGIPIIPFDEALHGLVRQGATAFPQSIGLAASFDTTLVSEVANAIAHECKSRGIRQILSPVVNLATDPRWGRVEETYGEDPYLSARIGVSYVSSFEKLGVITSPKHFVVNHGDGGRDSYPVHYSDRYMEETYYVPFKACFFEGKSKSVMTAYNSFDGMPCSANSLLLKDKLQKEWKFDGFSISDANAVDIMYYLHHTVPDLVHAGASALNNGLNVIFQVRYEDHKPYLEACKRGLVKQEDLDNSVRRVLLQKFRLGLFDHPYVDPEDASKWNGSKEYRELNLKAAKESIVLLKNEREVLPLSKKYKRVAILGEDAIESRLGGYSGPGIEKISILEGIKKKLGDHSEIIYSEGCKRTNPSYITITEDCLSSEGNKGLKGEYFDNINWEGRPKMVRYDKNMKFGWTLLSPNPDSLAYDWYSVRWTGKLVAPISGSYEIGVEGNDGYALYIDNQKVIDRPLKMSYTRNTVPFKFEKGRNYDIKLDFYENTRNGRLQLLWNIGVENEDSKMEEAVNNAKNSDAAIVVVGIEEAEFRDRAILKLPGRQEELINKVASTGKPMVVVIVGGSAVTMDSWIKNAPSIIDVWYPGDVGGLAVADVLFGDYNPGGKLPITFPQWEGQLTLTYNHKPTGRGDDYLDMSGEPLFPFGHGLSYTTFEYSNLQLSSQRINSKESITVSCTVQNSGSLKGEEVVQLYLHDMISDVARPINELKGFKRVSLESGERKVLQFTLDSESLSHLGVNMKRIIEPGDFRVMIGSSSKDIRLKGIFNVYE